MGSGTEWLCLMTYMKFFHRAAPRRLVFERLFKTAVLSCVERLFYCGMCPFVRRAEKINEAQIEDQSGILAQNFFVVRKTSAGFFRDPLFRTIPNPVSSAHFLTAAKTVHTNARGWEFDFQEVDRNSRNEVEDAIELNS